MYRIGRIIDYYRLYGNVMVLIMIKYQKYSLEFKIINERGTLLPIPHISKGLYKRTINKWAPTNLIT